MKVGKWIMLGILVFLMCTPVLMASETRIVTLGYNANFYIRDSYNIWAFPSTIVNYQNMIFAESESPYGNALWRGGIHIPLSPTLVIGVYVSNEKQYFDITDTDYLGNSADHQYDVFVGMDGTNTDFGLHLQTFGRKVDYTNAADANSNWSEKLSVLAFSGGVSHKMNPQTRFDAAIFYQSNTFASIYNFLDPDQYLEPYKYNMWGIGARLFHALSSKSILVPFAAYGSGGAGYQWLVTEANNPYGDPFKSARYGGSGYVVGVALDLIPKENNLVTLASGLEGSSSDMEVTYYMAPSTLPLFGDSSHTILPFINIGLESRIARWLDARFSFYQLFESTKDRNPVSNTQLDEKKETMTSYSANFGLAFHLGQFDIDVLVDTDYLADFLHNGPYVLSGNNYEGDLFGQVSVTYTFPKDEKKD